MYKYSALLTYYTLTPLHMGSGSSLSYIDLPIQRERHTSFPIMAASGIKGVFRNLAHRKWDDKEIINIIFGPEDGNQYSSCISFTDAKILLYPVRSLKGIFAWITCPFVINRFKKELENLTNTNPNSDFNFNKIEDDQIIVSKDSLLKITENKVALEEFVFQIINNENDNLKKLTNLIKENIELDEIKDLEKRVAIVSDDVFTNFVNYAVEVRTRIKIDQITGVVEEGALFTLELIPSEAIFYNFLFIGEPKINNKSNNDNKIKNDDIKNKFKELFNQNLILQFGGDETIGLGFVKTKMKELNQNQTQKTSD